MVKRRSWDQPLLQTLHKLSEYSDVDSLKDKIILLAEANGVTEEVFS